MFDSMICDEIICDWRFLRNHILCLIYHSSTTLIACKLLKSE